jgi:Leucine-rich repeat (LRR) protein
MSDIEADRDERLAHLLDQALLELRSHGSIDVGSWLARHPEFAQELPGLLEALDSLDNATADSRSLTEETREDPPAGTGDDPSVWPLDDETRRPKEIGRYRILGLLGSGGMGTVYKAHDPKLNRQVAIKVPRFKGPPEVRTAAQQRFLREARAAAAVRHSHICPIHDVGEAHDVRYVVMAYVEGSTLDDCVAGQPPLDCRLAADLVRQVAEALAAVHAKGIIHRDIKPRNILLDAGGQPLLTDFGLARTDNDAERLTVEGALLGTPAYMAPEQASLVGEPVGPGADLYSLGVVLYRLVAGRTPFQGQALPVIQAVAAQSPPPPSRFRPDLDPALKAIIHKAMARRPEDRYRDAGAFAAALAGWLTGAGHTTPAPRPTRPARPSRLRWAIAAAVLLALVPVGYFFSGTVIRFATNQGEVVIQADDRNIEVVIKDQAGIIIDKGSKREYTVRAGAEHEALVTVKDDKGDVTKFATKKFTVSRGGREVLRVELQLAKARSEPRPSGSGSADPDRRAAEYVLSIGGKVRVNDQERDTTAAAGLPKEAFRLTCVDLMANKQLTDAGLAHLKVCKNLTHLNLDGTRVSDAGLAHFKDYKNLAYLEIGNTRVSDAGLAHLKECKNLNSLSLGGTQVSDAGLAHLKVCKNLTQLHLWSTQVSDAGLAHLKDCKNLKGLNLGGTRVSDAGLAHLKDCENLTVLDLRYTRVSDAGLAHLKDCKNLTILVLTSTQVSDAGLKHLHALTQLQKLELAGMKVTAEGVAALRKALPKCEIAWTDPDRRAAEYVLSIGGKVRVNDQERDTTAAAGLPKEAFRLTYVDLMANKQLTDAGLAHLKDCKNLNNLYLANTRVSDAGLAHLKDCKSLTQLNLFSTQVSDAGLVHLKDCKNLGYLGLDHTRVSDAGLAPLKDCKNLTQLNLFATQVSDAGLARLKDCKNLNHLNLGGTRVSDVGLPHLKDCNNLTALHLGGTRVTDEGLAHLKDCKNLTHLNLDGTRVSDAGLAHLKECKNLTQLHLWGTRVSDAGLAHLKECKNLNNLSLGGTRVSDAGLAHLKDCKNLTQLHLWSTQVSDAGLAHLKDSKNLKGLNLGGTRVSDAGLAHLKDCKNLNYLTLQGTQVSDAGLTHLKDCKNLTELVLHATRVSDAGLRELVNLPLNHIDLDYSRVSVRGFANLRSAFPNAQVLGEPRPSAAEDLLATGATLVVRAGEAKEDRLVKKIADLPKEPFVVRRAGCSGVKKPPADLLTRLSHWREYEFKRLEALDLSGWAIDSLAFAPPLATLQELNVSGTKVADLQPLVGLNQLRKLSLDRTPVADDALKALEGLPNLRKLDLRQTGVMGRGLTHLAKLPKLAELSLAGSKVSDLFAAKVGALTRLERLSLARCAVSDEGLKHLQRLTNLQELDLSGTKVTAAGVAALQKALPKCRIVPDPKGK